MTHVWQTNRLMGSSVVLDIMWTIILHVDEIFLRKVADVVEENVGKITRQTGIRHKFLRMDITFNKNGTVSIDMKDYVEEVLQAFPDRLKRSVTSPARPDLHHIDHTSPPLPIENADLFHSFVMKLMWVSQRCRLDILTTISFLCTRVTKPTE